MNGGRGVGWGLMKGEGVLLGRRHPCARSSSGEGGGMGNDGGGAAGPSSSVGARRPWVGGRGRPCALAGRP